MLEPSADLVAHAIRLHRRYLIEIVEKLGFCPWAKRSRVDGKIRQHVSMAYEEEAAISDTQEAITRWKLEEVDVAFVIFPRLSVTRLVFDSIAARVGEREGGRHPIGEVPFVMAAFHPDARPDTTTGERFIPFLRRTPDPCIQLVRVRILDAVRANTPQGTRLMDLEAFMKNMVQLPRDEMPLRERIARQNLATAKALGVEALAEKLADILADRDQTYATLAAR